MNINQIYHGDCLDLLKTIEDVSIDCVITDPPYFRVMKVDYKGDKYNWDNQWDTFKDYINWCKIWINELNRVVKSDGSIYVFQDDKICAYTQVLFEKVGFHLVNNIVWVKPNNMPIKGWKSYRCYAPITERILFFSKYEQEKSNRTFNPSKNYTDVWTFNMTSSSEKTYHPTQKPIEIIKRIINTSTKEDDLILDLFVGSGTVPVACKQLKRNWIGSEKEEEYIKVINKRLEQKYSYDYVGDSH